jgi:tetratricopeptide (TPR) repeat protein
MAAGGEAQRSGAFAAAAAAYRRAVEARGTSEAHAALARALRDGGQADEALEALRRALALDPASAPAWLLMGEVQLARGETAQARLAYHRYLELEPAGRDADDVRSVLERLQAR